MTQPGESREGKFPLPVPSGVDTRKQSVSFVGLGYVGLATAVCLASFGHRVYGVDIDEKKCELIQGGTSPIHEHGIAAALKNCVNAGTFSCTSDTRKAVVASDFTFVTVGTPSRPDGGIDLKYMDSAVSEIGRALKEKSGYHVVVVKSTVVPGTTMGRIRQILESVSGKRYPQDFGLGANPEFLREGTAIQDTMQPDALIIGTEDKRSSDSLLELYGSLYGREELPYTLVTETPNAEFVKYSVNTFRAVQLSYLNLLANLCEKTPSADVAKVITGLSAVTKIDQRYLRPGFGYGGSCLPKDLRALTTMFQKNGIDPMLLQSAAEVNQSQPLRAVDIAQQLLGQIDGRRIAVLGLTFKAETDDVRESVAIRIVSEFVARGAKVFAYDPQGIENAKSVLHDTVTYAESAISCLEGAECCVIGTEWKEFSQIPASAFKKTMRNPVIIDGKRILNTALLETEGVLVYELGRHFDVRHLEQVESINA